MSAGRLFADFFPCRLRAGAERHVVDRIVAVSTRKSSASELRRFGRAERQLPGRIRPRRRDVLERQMLERLISRSAAADGARTASASTAAARPRRWQRVAESNKMALAEFRRALEADGVSFELWRETARADPPDAAARARGGRQRSR